MRALITIEYKPGYSDPESLSTGTGTMFWGTDMKITFGGKLVFFVGKDVNLSFPRKQIGHFTAKEYTK